MKSFPSVGLADVQAMYNGWEGNLWELAMGQQIHIGGFYSSMDLAERAGIGAGLRGVDLCCCTGAGMRVLVRFLVGEFAFIREMAQAGKIAQGRFIARRR